MATESVEILIEAEDRASAKLQAVAMESEKIRDSMQDQADELADMAGRLDAVKKRFPDDPHLPDRLSLIQEGAVRKVRMAHLSMVGSHSVNGVADLHTRILKSGLFRDFDEIFPGRIRNVTNGITPRRWLYQANPSLSLPQ